MDRHPLALSAATGSLSSSILWLLKDLASGPTPIAVAEPRDTRLEDIVCPDCDIQVPFSFWSGVLVGFLVWPIIELLVLTKQWLTLALKARIAGLNPESRLYKVLG